MNLNFFIKKRLNRLFQYLRKSDPKEGIDVIKNIGYKNYVGGYWREIGNLQFEFLKREGLKHTDCIYDIGCGSLRGGQHFIKYLDENNYIGIDKEDYLIKEGLKGEIEKGLISLKKPTFIKSKNFNFSSIKRKPDIAIAQSLFTHLNIYDLSLCLKNLRMVVEVDHRFYATFFEGSPFLNRRSSNSFTVFFYRYEKLKEVAFELGWESHYIGDWGHPRNQRMIKFTPL